MAAASPFPLLRKCLVLASLALAPILPAQAQPALPLELNRLEPVTPPAEGCRIWMMLANDAPESAAINALRLDLVVFGADGQIARRAAVELAPVGAGRTAVRRRRRRRTVRCSCAPIATRPMAR